MNNTFVIMSYFIANIFFQTKFCLLKNTIQCIIISSEKNYEVDKLSSHKLEVINKVILEVKISQAIFLSLKIKFCVYLFKIRYCFCMQQVKIY